MYKMLKALKAYPNVLEYTMFLHFILQGNWPAKYRAHQQPRGCSPLDPNHSHFILVDNGTQHKFGTEIEFRAKFEQAACRLKSTTGIFTQDGPFLPCTSIIALCLFYYRFCLVSSDTIIPSVCVVLEGGPGTLKTVKSAIDSGTPAVIVEV